MTKWPTCRTGREVGPLPEYTFCLCLSTKGLVMYYEEGGLQNMGGGGE